MSANREALTETYRAAFEDLEIANEQLEGYLAATKRVTETRDRCAARVRAAHDALVDDVRHDRTSLFTRLDPNTGKVLWQADVTAPELIKLLMPDVGALNEQAHIHDASASDPTDWERTDAVPTRLPPTGAPENGGQGHGAVVRFREWRLADEFLRVLRGILGTRP